MNEFSNQNLHGVHIKQDRQLRLILDSISFLLLFQLSKQQLIVYKLQSAKILLLPPKYEIIMVPSNHSFFQYCDRNIGHFSIAPCKVITLNPLSILLCISSLLFFMALSLKLSLFHLSQQRQFSLFLALKGDSEKITLTFR